MHSNSNCALFSISVHVQWMSIPTDIFLQILNSLLSSRRHYLRYNCFAKQQEDVRHLWFTDWWQCLHNGKSALSAHSIIMWMMLEPCLCMCFSMITTESTFFLSILPFSAQSLKHQGGESERKTKKREEETPAVPQVFLRRVSVVIQCLREACGRLLMWFCVRFCVTTHSIAVRWTTTGNTNPALFVYSQI